MAEQAYFSRFQTFAPNPDATLMENFRQLAILKSWGKKSKKFKEERKSYMLALADTHLGNIDRGGTAERLVALQELCEELGVKPVPSSINQCNKQLSTVHVCLVDLIDSRRLHSRVHVFKTLSKLQKHIKATGHYFPKEEAKRTGGGILKVLLRVINE